jgi:hypothetical protein
MSDKYREVRRTATELLRQAFPDLERNRVLPRSRYEPWIHVGREYEGYLIHHLPAFAAFESVVEGAFPQLFAQDGGLPRDFASLYAFPLIAAAVARLTRAGAEYTAQHPAVGETVNELISYLRAGREPATVIRLVSDLRPVSGITVRELRIQPEGMFRNGNFESSVEDLIPGMGYEIERDQVITSGRSRAMLIVSLRPRVDESDRVYGAFSNAVEDARSGIDRFLSAARLATGSTIRNMVEVDGQPGWFKKYPGDVHTFPHHVMPTVDRVAAIDRRLALRVRRLEHILSEATSASGGTVPSLALSIGRFNRAFSAAPWTDCLVDLTVALEAAIGEPDEKQDVTLRLRSRAASLLASTSDSASEIFTDLGKLYDLRSAVVHGHPHREVRVRKLIESIPATAIGIMAADKVDLAIDRLRDIARRAILARLFLASGANAVWPLGARSDMDRRLTDDRERRRLRDHWRRALGSLGLAGAREKAGPPDVLGSRSS